VLTEGKGVPIGCIIAEANRTDMKKLEALLDACVVALPVLPEDAPAAERPQLCLDRGYDYEACRETARAHGYVPHIPRRASKGQPLPPPDHPDRHPPRRWVVEIPQPHYPHRAQRAVVSAASWGILLGQSTQPWFIA
jgi:putative transposase